MSISETEHLSRQTQRLAPVAESEDEAGLGALDHLAALDRLNRMVAGFASMVSHETRSALVGIQGASELIRFGGLSADEIQTCAVDIYEQSQRINALIGDMFDLNRLETNQVRLRRTAVDLNAIAQEVISSTCIGPGIPVVHVRLAPDPPAILGDPDRLRQALGNFLEFALRQAHIDSAIAVTTEVQPNRVRVGIASDSMTLGSFDDWLFGRYERYERKPSSIMGAGLGLAIARVIVELHDGRVWVDRPGDVVELNFFLPIRTAPAQA